METTLTPTPPPPLFAQTTLNTHHPSSADWSERQFVQLKNQIIAYKHLIRFQPVPLRVYENIRSYTPEEWTTFAQLKLRATHQHYKELFSTIPFTVRDLNIYFRQCLKEEEASAKSKHVHSSHQPELDVEYTLEKEIAKRQQLLEKYVANLQSANDPSRTAVPGTAQLLQSIRNEQQLIKMFFVQKKLHDEIGKKFSANYNRYYSVDHSDSFLYRTLLERSKFKKRISALSRDQRLNTKFEKELRNGYDKRKKEKQHEFLSQVMNRYKDFTEMHKERKLKMKKLSQNCKSIIENMSMKEQRDRERRERERIQHIKNNNMEEYRRLLKDVQDKRLEEFMNQTDQFLKEIEDKIKVQKEIISKFNASASAGDRDGASLLTEANEDKNLLKIEEDIKNEHDAQLRENVSNSRNYYLSAHSHVEDIDTQPQMLKFGQLKTYQLVGLQWLVSLYVNNLNGILADEMGLGKTIQTIALLCYIIEVKHNEGPFLIIAPLATLSNWVLEFNRWAPEIKIVAYKGQPQYRKQLAYQIKQEKHRYNVILTTYEYIMKDKYNLNKITWQYIIVDEGHRMKNYKSKFTQTLGAQFNSVYRLLLTGTPLQNNLSELWALLNFLLPKIFNSCEDFEKWFNQPFSSKLPGEKNTELTEEQELLIINRLHTVLRPFLLRREKKDVEKELPSKTEYVIKIELSAWQRMVYTQIKEQGLLTEDPTAGKMAKKALMNTMMELRKICNHPYLFLHHNNELLENINECIYKSSGKFEFLDRIIPKLLLCNHKILIFSQMTRLMDVLEKYFHYKGILYLRLDGNTKADDRGSQIQLFSDEKSEYKVFILSTRAGGLGLNLQAADTVIIFDSDWNPQMDIQAQDRAHRIGQKHKVKVFRLISKDTIEEGILEKAAFKKTMDEKVIRAGLYNVRYSEQERRNNLLNILKNEKEEEEEEDVVPDDSQINEYISRSEMELELFEEMDRKRYIAEAKEARLQHIKEKMNHDDKTMKNVNYRLIQEFEVPEWVKCSNNKEEEANSNIVGANNEEGVMRGKGMRIHPNVNYREYFEDESNSDADSNNNSRMLRKKKKRNHSSRSSRHDGDSSDNNYDEQYSRSSRRRHPHVSANSDNDEDARNHSESNHLTIKLHDVDVDDEEEDNDINMEDEQTGNNGNGTSRNKANDDGEYDNDDDVEMEEDEDDEGSVDDDDDL